jgi:hypothetical protein
MILSLEKFIFLTSQNCLTFRHPPYPFSMSLKNVMSSGRMEGV